MVLVIANECGGARQGKYTRERDASGKETQREREKERERERSENGRERETRRGLCSYGSRYRAE